MTDAIVIGGGVNGLVCALALARRKKSVILVEQHDTPGGAAMTSELVPGFRVPTLSHALGPLHRDIARALRLDRDGVDVISPDPALTTIAPDGRTISFHRDAVLTAGSINQVSPKDAARWKEFVATTQRIGALMSDLARQIPPAIDDRSAGDAWALLGLGRKARALGRRNLIRLTRWTPMAVADLTSEWFESELLQAAICAHAVMGHPAGPWSAGTGGMLLQRLGEDPVAVGSGTTVRGGPGALSAALAKRASAAGVSIRTGARVRQINVSHGRATGVVLENGDELAARIIVGAVHPKHLLLDLVAPTDLPHTYAERIVNFRSRGVTAKINLALSALPAFTALHGDAVPLRGRLLIAPDVDYVERAFDATKYGEMSSQPWLEIALPSTIDSSLAPEAGHVMSIYVHYAPRHLRGDSWAAARDRLLRSAMDVLEQAAPGLGALVVGRQVVTPEDLEERWGTSGGHIFHGEHALDQSWMARPLLGWSRYTTPIAGLLLASAGAHPGGGLTGLPGWLAAKTAAAQL